MVRGLIFTGDGFEDIQLEYASHRLREDAVLTSVVSPSGGDITGARGHTWHDTVPIADLPVVDKIEIVIVPGGRAPEKIRLSDEALEWLRSFESTGGIVGTIGHGIQVLISIDVLDGRMVTGPLELADDIENAAATYTGEEVAVDGSLVTARGTSALPFFVSATLNNVLITQDPAWYARERPHWKPKETSE